MQASPDHAWKHQNIPPVSNILIVWYFNRRCIDRLVAGPALAKIFQLVVVVVVSEVTK